MKKADFDALKAGDTVLLRNHQRHPAKFNIIEVGRVHDDHDYATMPPGTSPLRIDGHLFSAARSESGTRRLVKIIGVLGNMVEFTDALSWTREGDFHAEQRTMALVGPTDIVGRWNSELKDLVLEEHNHRISEARARLAEGGARRTREASTKAALVAALLKRTPYDKRDAVRERLQRRSAGDLQEIRSLVETITRHSIKIGESA